jgi:endonuclease YncB( thermonuclease family)
MSKLSRAESALKERIAKRPHNATDARNVRIVDRYRSRIMRITVAATLLALGMGGCGVSEDIADEADPTEVTTASTRAREMSTKPPEVERTSARPTPTHRPTADAEPGPKPLPEPTRDPEPKLHLVSRVIDGDTIELANGQSVRIVGIDTPEQGNCGYDEATANMERLVLAERIRLGKSDEDTDQYGRLLRYANVGPLDAGLRQIKAGMAVARYDSRDGYGRHPREDRYIVADDASTNVTCDRPAPKPGPAPSGCEVGYSPCVPPYPPDVNCDDVNGPIRVTGPDPHGLDADGDGVACES